MHTTEMPAYYAQRAKVYEDIYHRREPSRVREQVGLRRDLTNTLRSRRVLEVACGTGYWTQFAALTARSIVAADINPEVLDIAKRTKEYASEVTFRRADAFHLPFKQGSFSGGLANFWFSHIPKARRIEFLDHFHSFLQPGSSVFMADNVYNEGVGGELLTPDGEDDTFKLRNLDDGSQFTIVKNYPTQEELETIFEPYASRLDIHFGQHFWHLSYHTK